MRKGAGRLPQLGRIQGFMDFLFQGQHIGRGQLQPVQRTLAVAHPLGVGLQAFMATHQVLGQQTRGDQGDDLRIGCMTRVLAIAGPTASGKSAASLALAVILSC